jgi:hypothetical protein
VSFVLVACFPPMFFRSCFPIPLCHLSSSQTPTPPALCRCRVSGGGRQLPTPHHLCPHTYTHSHTRTHTLHSSPRTQGMVLVSFVVVTLLDHRATPPNDAVPAMYATSPPASYAPPPPPPPPLPSASLPPLSPRTKSVPPKSATCSLASAPPSEGRETLDRNWCDGERRRDERGREAMLTAGFSSSELLRRYAEAGGEEEVN